MAFRFCIDIRQEKENLLEQLGSEISHNLFQFDFNFRSFSSLNPERTLHTFIRSVVGRRDLFLAPEYGPNLVHSMVADSRLTQEFIDDELVPDILTCAWHTDSRSMNLGRQVIKLRVELLIQLDPEDEINELIDESLRSSVSFKPASKSSIEALKRVKLGDEDEDHLPLKKRRKLFEGLSSRKECSVCLDEFSNGDEVASTPCGHVYHDSCIVQWFETSHMCPLCRYPMPTR